MKDFKKNKNLEFICEECDKEFKNKEILCKHIKKYHGDIKIYFDKWLKENTDGICKICGKPTYFNNLKGYRIYCSKKCVNNDVYIREKIKNTNYLKYGFNTPIQNEEIKKKIQKTNLKKYDSVTPFHSKKIQEKCKLTIKEKYGVTNSYLIPNIRKKALVNAHLEKANEKRIKSLFKTYGVDNAFKSDIIKEKIKETTKNKYGVIFNSQNYEIHKKQQINGFQAKQYKNTNIYYRGSYELDFLEKYYNKYPDMQNAPSVKYTFDGKEKVYFPDFYIPSLNLIIECKSTYYYNKFLEKNKSKEFETRKYYNYILILDKNELFTS
jgi:hypothetical protein